MTPREKMLSLLQREGIGEVPIWLMGFESAELARRLNPEYELPVNLSAFPEKDNYPWGRLSDDERSRTINYNNAIDKPVVTVGWGANMSFGHGGPGEFHYELLEVKENERVLRCETGVKRLVRKEPYFFNDFDYPLKAVSEVDSLDLPDPQDTGRYEGIAEDVEFFKDAGFLTSANLNGFFSSAHYFCIDYQEFLMSTVLAPENTKRLIDTLGRWNIAAAEQLLKRGVECIVLCDDLGSADNLLIKPEHYRRWILPWHRRLCELAHGHGAYVHLHSHGNINSILESILSSGVDMLNPFDIYESMDLVAFLDSHGSMGTVPVGGLHKFFFDWDRDKQREYLTDIFARAKGPWVFMDTGGLPGTLDKEGYDFFMEELRKLSRR